MPSVAHLFIYLFFFVSFVTLCLKLNLINQNAWRYVSSQVCGRRFVVWKRQCFNSIDIVYLSFLIKFVQKNKCKLIILNPYNVFLGVSALALFAVSESRPKSVFVNLCKSIISLCSMADWNNNNKNATPPYCPINSFHCINLEQFYHKLCCDIFLIFI